MSTVRILVLLALVCAGTATPQDIPAKPVVTAKVVQREVRAGRAFVASVAPARQTTVGSELEGLVVEYLAREGQRVEKGAVLARLRTKVVETRLAAARAQLELRSQELAELVNGARPEEIAQAKARVGRAAAEVETRRWKLGNTTRLQERGSVSEDELKDAELALRDAEERQKEAKAALDLVVAGPRKERIAQATARRDAQQAVVEQLEDELERHTIRAPFNGFVVVEHTQIGAWVQQGGAVAELVELDQVDVVVPVLEDYIAGVTVGLKVTVVFDSLPKERFEGAVAQVVPLAEPRARTFPVKIRIPNRERGGTVMLKAGMFARVTAAIGKTVPALMVPKDALVLGGAKPEVWVVDPETMQVRPVPVELGIPHDDSIQVLGQLKAGQEVVVRGNERLRPGDRVSTGR